MAWHTLYLFLPFLFYQHILAQIYPHPYALGPGKPFAPPPFRLISHPCAIDITGENYVPPGTRYYEGNTFHCGPITLVVREDEACYPDLYAYGTLTGHTTASLYFQAGHLGSQLYDTTATFAEQDFNQPRTIGCFRRGDGVDTVLYTYSDK